MILTLRAMLRSTAVTRLSRAALSLAAMLAWQTDAAAIQEPRAPDPRAAYLAAHALDPAAEDVPLPEGLRAARVVVLSTPSYGDGAAYAAFARLLPRLHQELGFDVLAFEAGLSECEVLAERLGSKAPLPSVAPLGLYFTMAGSAELMPLLARVRESLAGERPIRVVGLDPNPSGKAAEFLPDRVLAALGDEAARQLPAEQRRALRDLWSRLRDPTYAPSAERLAQDRERIAWVDARLAAAEGAAGGDALLVQRRVLRNLSVLAEMRHLQGSGRVLEASNLQSRTMGENLLWLAEQRYPGRRIVVLTTNRHAARDLAAIEGEAEAGVPFASLETLGDVAHAALGEAYYAVLTLAGLGTAGFEGLYARELEPPRDGSLEAALRSFGNTELLLDLRAAAREPGRWPQVSLLARPLHYTWAEAVWPAHADAVLYVDRMTPSEHPEDG